jgi:hypothetical protein
MESLRASLKYTADKKKVKVRSKLIRDDEGKVVALVVQAYNGAEVRKLRTVTEGEAEAEG